jgi:hypothetical protein
MPLKTIRRPISPSNKKFVTPVKNGFVSTLARQTFIPSMRREKWWLSLLGALNVAPARSPVSTVLSDGNTPGVASAYNIALDDEKQIKVHKQGRPASLPT